MNAEQLIAHYERVAEAPDAIARLRRLVIRLAVRGRLVPQDQRDSFHPELLIRIKSCCRPAAGHPLGWAQSTVGSLLDFQYGSGLKAADRLSEGPVAVYGSNGVVGFTAVPLTKKPSIIVGRKGSAGALNVCNGPSWTTDVAYFVEAPSYFDLWFLFHALTALGLEKLGRGVKPGLSRADAYALPISVPPLAEQHRIVAKVDELMALCDRLEAARAQREATRDRLTASTLARLNTPAPPASPDGDASKASSFQSDARFALTVLPALTTRVDHIRQLRQTILNLAVRGKLVAQSSLGLELREARLEPSQPPGASFDIPVGWRWEKLASLGSLRGGGTPSKARREFWVGPIPWVSPKDMKVDYVADAQLHVSEAAIAGSAANLIDAGSILFVVRGMILAHSFPVAITQCGVAINQDMKALTLKQPGMAEYVLRALKGLKPEMLKRVQRSSHGTCRLEGSDYADFLIPIPPLAEQHRIVAKVDELMALCDQLEASLSRRDSTRSRLLNALLHEALQTSHENVIDFEATRQRLLEKRQAVACRIVERLSRTMGFGRVRAVKPLYFAEAHCGVALGGQWGRADFGPYDHWIRSFESEAVRCGWLTYVERRTSDGNTRIEYTPGPQLSSKAQSAAQALGNGAAEFERVLTLLAGLDTSESEIVATLYAAWNDLLIEKKPVSDDLVISEFREQWGVARKADFKPAHLREWLGWMRANQLTPKGQGPSTHHQAKLV